MADLKFFLKHLFFAVFAFVLVFVGCSAEENGCPEFCKGSRKLSKAEADMCGIWCPGKKEPMTDECLKTCLEKNPEGAALCELNCKISSSNKVEVAKVESSKKALGESPNKDISVDDAMSMVGTMMNVHSRINNMMDCMMDGLNHQMNYGWIGDFFKNRSPLDSSAKVNEGMKSADLNDLMKIEKLNEGTPTGNKMSGFERPVFHRFLIIKNIPFMSVVKEEEELNSLNKDKLMTGENKKKVYSMKVETEITMTSGSKFSVWLKNLLHNEKFRRFMWLMSWSILMTVCSIYLIILIIRIWTIRCASKEVVDMECENKYQHLIPLDEELFFIVNCQNVDEKKQLPTDAANVYVPIPYKSPN
ncbi:hypothetical protein HELRODRAFT_189435 [Helobdella robusta]|uniref:TNFR-Cys domain-containing protein n=1 Tax=Helobdella robusta TaxID=6412 RepID=T1FR20_HELRO|nr:hypothetical protein HELRODRAFT_189435 [Helobdella robusta]ESN94567.1 hypothetical protein HELRODRAFT_189435 [Helobdella robusta]